MKIKDVTVVKGLALKLYIVAFLVYALSVLSRTIFEGVAHSPNLSQVSRLLAKTLSFLVSELQALTVPPVATICLICAFLLNPVLVKLCQDND